MKYFNSKLGLLVLIYVMLNACGPNTRVRTEVPISEEKSDELLELSFEKVSTEIKDFSGQGFFRVQNDEVLFFDGLFNTVSFLNQQGEIDSVSFGKGEGPTEIPQTFVWHNYDVVGNHVFMGRVSNFFTYTPSFNRVNSFVYSWMNRKAMYKGTSPIDINMYGLDLILPPTSSRWLAMDSEGMVFIPVRVLEKSNMDYNYLREDYYHNAYSIAVINPESWKQEKGFGFFPEDYKGKVLPKYDDKYLVVKNDSIYVGYNASPEIQVYSPYPELKHIYSFGMVGQGMNIDYPNIRTRNDLRNAKKNKSYYTDLYFDQEDGLLFRSYVKSIAEKTAGLQVYRGKRLIADIAVPLRFNVVGRIGESYIVDGVIDEEMEEVAFYRLTF